MSLIHTGLSGGDADQRVTGGSEVGPGHLPCDLRLGRPAGPEEASGKAVRNPDAGDSGGSITALMFNFQELFYFSLNVPF